MKCAVCIEERAELRWADINQGRKFFTIPRNLTREEFAQVVDESEDAITVAASGNYYCRALCAYHLYNRE